MIIDFLLTSSSPNPSSKPKWSNLDWDCNYNHISLYFIFSNLCRLHLVLHDEVGGHHGGGPGPAHHAVDHHQAAARHRRLDEGGRGRKISEN